MMRDAAALIGVDVGTEAVRAVVIDTDGVAHATASVALRSWFPKPGWAEQDPQQVWNATITAVRSAVTGCGAVRIAALALTTTSVTLVTADEAGEPTGPAMLWMDTRAAAEAREITETRHPALWFTGGRVSPEWMLPKALWLARHEQPRFRQAARIVELHDWLIHRLTGKWTAALGLVCSGWSYVPERGGWPHDLLEVFGIGSLAHGWVQDPLAPGAPIGPLTAAAASACGLDAPVLVAQGTMDSYAAALACGVLEPGRLAISLGSSSCYLAVADQPLWDQRLLGPVPGAFGERYGIQGGQTSAGSVVRWFRTQFARDATLAELDAEAARWPVGAGGARAIDTFQGSRTPFRDPARRGALWGLTLAHDRGAVYRALLESVALGGRLIVDVLRQAGVVVSDVVACGGASRSGVWMQIHADALGVPLTTLDAAAAAATGAAICAAGGAGLFGDVAAAATAMSRAGDRYQPDTRLADAYEALLADYAAVSCALAAACRYPRS